ncbi:MAG: DUF4350 domain-containing protein [Desulfosporosinus sp.]|nr:DUF4350 domain-containing protein [Desulfosporosinus sp.]
MSKLRKLILIVATLFVLLSIVALSANGILAASEDENQNPSIIIKAKGTYGNYTKRGAWLPLEVEVANQGKDLQGSLRVIPNDAPPGFSTLDYVSSAVLPQGSIKAFDFYIPVQGSLTSVMIELISSEKVLAKQSVSLISLSDVQWVIGLLDRSEEGFSSLSGLKQANWLTPELCTVKNADLPEKAELLNLFNVLIIDDVNLKLTKEQADALTHWVSRGGTLVVGGGSGWQKVLPNLPPELQTVKVSGVETITLSALPSSLSEPAHDALPGPVQIADLQSSQGKTLFSEQGHPLAIKSQLGDGQVVYLAYDPALEPMSNWSGAKVLWKDLLINEKPDFANIPVFGQTNNLNGMANALGNIEGMALPSLRNMALVLGLYLLLAGLVNYLVLKKLDKREWTWITVPALAMVFVVLIYFTSFKTRPAEVISHQINVVDVKQGTSLAKVTSIIGLFAPNHETYNLQFPGRHLIGALPDIDGGIGMGSGTTTQNPKANISVEQTPEQTNLEFQQMRSWVMRGFSSVEDASLTGSISGEITYQDNKWLATITNSTHYNFTDGVIISSANWFAKLGALQAGGQTQREIEMNQTSRNNNPGMPLAYQIYNPQVNWQGPGAPPRPQAKDMLRQQILESLISDGAGSLSGNKLLFLGWSVEPFQEGLNITDKDVKKYYTTLFQVPLTLKFDPEHLEVPEGILSGTLLSSQNVGFGPGSIVIQPNSEAVYQLELPVGKFSEMKLNIHQRNGSSFSAVNGYLYNWKTAAWEDIGMTTDNTVIKESANYINGDRLVRFKISNQSQSQVQAQQQFASQPQQLPQQEFYGVSISLRSQGVGNK